MGEEYTLRDTVFREFLSNPNLGPSEMADRLKAKYNSVKAVYAQLCEDGLLIREGRGNYSPNVPRILVFLMDRVEALEKGGK
jgi:Mn-dependent DtxR family transcriptional regulator